MAHNSGACGIAYKPTDITNPTLNNVVNSLYKEGDEFLGGTAGAVRRERATGEMVGNRWHSQKAEESIRALTNLINSGQLNERDLAFALALRNDLGRALRGK